MQTHERDWGKTRPRYAQASIGVVALFGFGCGGDPGVARPAKHQLVFTAPRAEATPTGAPEQITLPGRLFDPPIPVTPVRETEVDRHTPVKAFASVFSALKANDDAWIFENYVPAEREKVKRFLTGEQKEKNRSFFAGIQRAELTGRCDYKGFVLLFFRYPNTDSGPLIATFTERAGQWLRTDALDDEPTYELIVRALSEGEVKAAGKET